MSKKPSSWWRCGFGISSRNRDAPVTRRGDDRVECRPIRFRKQVDP